MRPDDGRYRSGNHGCTRTDTDSHGRASTDHKVGAGVGVTLAPPTRRRWHIHTHPCRSVNIRASHPWFLRKDGRRGSETRAAPVEAASYSDAGSSDSDSMML